MPLDLKLEPCTWKTSMKCSQGSLLCEKEATRIINGFSMCDEHAKEWFEKAHWQAGEIDYDYQ